MDGSFLVSVGLEDGGVFWTEVTSGSPQPMVVVGHRSITDHQQVCPPISLSVGKQNTDKREANYDAFEDSTREREKVGICSPLLSVRQFVEVSEGDIRWLRDSIDIIVTWTRLH